MVSFLHQSVLWRKQWVLYTLSGGGGEKHDSLMHSAWENRMPTQAPPNNHHLPWRYAGHSPVWWFILRPLPSYQWGEAGLCPCTHAVWHLLLPTTNICLWIHYNLPPSSFPYEDCWSMYLMFQQLIFLVSTSFISPTTYIAILMTGAPSNLSFSEHANSGSST